MSELSKFIPVKFLPGEIENESAGGLGGLEQVE